MKTIYTILVLLNTISAITCCAQSMEIGQVEFKGGKLLVQYSLADSVSGRTYTVRAYCSRDNYLNPLEKVSGDVGLQVKAGPRNVLIWDFHQEQGQPADATVALELRARIFIPFINTESINQYKVFKKHHRYNLTWSGGTPQNILNFDLYKGERKIITFPNIGNVGHHTVEFPSVVRPGKDYHFVISDSKNNEDVVTTDVFQIKRRVPLLAKLLPLAVIGYAAYYLSAQAGEQGSIIPDPPTGFK
jgi:hypothetical protein